MTGPTTAARMLLGGVSASVQSAHVEVHEAINTKVDTTNGHGGDANTLAGPVARAAHEVRQAIKEGVHVADAMNTQARVQPGIVARLIEHEAQGSPGTTAWEFHPRVAVTPRPSLPPPRLVALIQLLSRFVPDRTV